MNRRKMVVVTAALFCGLALAAPSQGQVTPLASDFRIDHANPEASVPSVAARNAKPLEFGYFIQDLAMLAETAGKNGDHLAESRYYRALTKAVPDSAAGFSKLCEALDGAHQRDNALSACRQALGLVGATSKDYVRFVHLTLDKSPLTPDELEDVKQAVAHLRQTPETSVAGNHLQCELGVKIGSIPLLEECTAALAAVAPRDPKTIAFQWALALRQGDRERARKLIVLAKSTGLKADGIARMERATDLLVRPWRDWLLDWRVLLTALAGAIMGFGILYLRRRRDLAKPRLQLPDGATTY